MVCIITFSNEGAAIVTSTSRTSGHKEVDDVLKVSRKTTRVLILEQQTNRHRKS